MGFPNRKARLRFRRVLESRAFKIRVAISTGLLASGSQLIKVLREEIAH